MSPENMAVHSSGTRQLSHLNTTTPLLIGNAIHILNHRVHKALVMQDREMFADLVRRQVAAGAQALAVNLGPAKEMGRLTAWAVDTIREHTQAPLFFSAGIMAQPLVLRKHGCSIAVNAVTANHDDLVRGLAAAQEYGSSLVVLLVRSGTTTAGLDDRLQLASEVLELALLKGLPLSRLYLDPILTSRPDPAAWHVDRGLPDVGSAAETIAMIKQLDSRVKTIVALGNGSAGMAREQRGGFHGRMLSLLTESGLDAVLLNCHDPAVMRTAEAVQRSRALHCRIDSGMMPASSMF